MSRPDAARLADGRLHLQHGPIDLVIGVEGDTEAVRRAEDEMTRRFETVLDELVGELDLLRRDVNEGVAVEGAIATHMLWHTASLSDGDFATSMIAVAGAVADTIATAGWASAPLRRIHVNNGGDIALRQVADATTVVGVVDDVRSGRVVGRLHIAGDSGIGGIATSGWGGRSMSLGIADAVTVLATNAVSADIAATLCANAVDLPSHPAVERRPARSLRDDTDLADRLVTCAVGDLADDEVEAALDAGVARATRAVAHPEVHAVVLRLRGRTRMVGDVPAISAAGTRSAAEN